MRPLAAILVIFIYAIAQGQQAVVQGAPQSTSLGEKLASIRYDLRVDQGALVGSGANVLAQAVSQAQYVLIGEDHFTREIPVFTSAICGLAAPGGLAGMALEVSPEAAAFAESTFGQPDRWAQMVSLTKQYPSSLAFLDSKQENDLVDTCAHLSHNPSFHLWGLDQTFLGSAGWLINKMLAAHPGPSAKAALNKLKLLAQEDSAQALSAGQYAPLFLMSGSSDQALQATAPAIKQDGGPAVQKMFHELVLSHEIYSVQGRGGDGNFMRARLLKQNFRMAVQSLPPTEQNKKIIVKFGEWHLYRGFNPLHHLDLGNYIAEHADVDGKQSLSICVLGAKGVHRAYGKYGQQSTTETFSSIDDRWYHWMAPVIAGQLPNSWTLYDLRKLRFQNLAGVDPDLARVIDGYDLLVVIPELT
jgi:hypothetical protein